MCDTKLQLKTIEAIHLTIKYKKKNTFLKSENVPKASFLL